MKLRKCVEVLLLLLMLLLTTDFSFRVDASEVDSPAVDNPSADAACGDSSSAVAADDDGSTHEQPRCTVTKVIERDRSLSWWLGDGDGLPPFCKRLEPPAPESDVPAEAAASGRWPWLVMFGRQKVSGPLAFGLPPPRGTEGVLRDPNCGGVLVGWGFVLTAAHCLAGDLSINDSGAVAVLLGDQATARPDGTFAGAVRRVSHVLRHPTGDIALALLDVMYEGFPKWVRPVCLPWIGVQVPVGLQVEVAGWSEKKPAGVAAPGSARPRVLREAELRVSDPAQCEAAYSDTPLFEWSFPGGVNGTAVCAEGGSEVPHAAWCSAQGGWPLIRLLADRRMYELVGISTSGAGCGDPSLPSVFTRVSAYMKWIAESLTPDQPDTQPGREPEPDYFPHPEPGTKYEYDPDPNTETDYEHDPDSEPDTDYEHDPDSEPDAESKAGR